jgi:UDP-N-acetylmuramoyl-tripeptide--D-alanyl-D-alanine ligase
VTTDVATVVLTADSVVEATGGRLAGGPASTPFDGVSIDSRTVAPGALFIAIKGDRFDGHDYIDAAIARGAAGVVAMRPPADPGPAAVVVVPDTLRALQALGRWVRRASQARVVAITGSAGKTTTKEITADFLSARYRVFRNQGNLNNHVGLPLSLVELRHGPEIAVVELGMNHAGELRTLVGLAEPDIRVWINVGDAHVGHFGSREAVAMAKAEILEAASADAVLVANADDDLVAAHASRFPGRTIRFGERAGADIRAVQVIDHGVAGVIAELATPMGALHLTIPLPGRAHLSNVLAATAVALELGVSGRDIEARAASLRPVARRGAMTTLANGTRIVDDSYNASPSATIAMLQALAATRTTGRRVAVIGEMLELGDAARDLHQQVGRAAAAAKIDLVVAVGGAATDGVLSGAIAGGLRGGQVYRFPTSAIAAEGIATLIAPGDLVLVKGSRGTRTDLIVDRLQEEV